MQAPQPEMNKYQLLLELKQSIDVRKQTEKRLRTVMSVLLARSENQILVLETLLKRLVQVCVQTQDKRLAKELKLIEFTRLAKKIGEDHSQMRQLIMQEDSMNLSSSPTEAYFMDKLKGSNDTGASPLGSLHGGGDGGPGGGGPGPGPGPAGGNAGPGSVGPGAPPGNVPSAEALLNMSGGGGMSGMMPRLPSGNVGPSGMGGGGGGGGGNPANSGGLHMSGNVRHSSSRAALSGAGDMSLDDPLDNLWNGDTNGANDGPGPGPMDGSGMQGLSASHQRQNMVQLINQRRGASVHRMNDHMNTAPSGNLDLSNGMFSNYS